MTVQHNEDFPVSASTYSSGHCRCDECAAAARWKRATSSRIKLTQRARSRATNKVVQWVMREHPDLWREYLSAARAELEAEHPEMAVDRRLGPR